MKEQTMALKIMVVVNWQMEGSALELLEKVAVFCNFLRADPIGSQVVSVETEWNPVRGDWVVFVGFLDYEGSSEAPSRTVERAVGRVAAHCGLAGPYIMHLYTREED